MIQHRDPPSERPTSAASRLVTDALGDGHWRTRAQLVRRTGLSPRTVGRVVARLVDRGVLEAGQPWSAGGRPAVPVRLPLTRRHIGAVALLRDEVAAAVVTPDGVLLEAQRFTDRSWRGVDDIADLCRTALERTTAAMARTVDLDAVVIGFPLPYRPGVGHVPLQRSRTFSEDWMHGDLAAFLTAELGLPVTVENTCKLAALAEHRFGAGRGFDDVIHLQLVGGCNTGVIAGGRLLRGAGGYAGEISHLHVDPDGPPCPCGARGCLGVSMENSDRLISTWKQLLPGETDLYEVLGLAVQGDPRLRHLLYELGSFVGDHLAVGCLMLNPQLLVVDGSLGLAVAPVVSGVEAALRSRLPDRVFEGLRIVPGRWGSEAALVGAAALDLVA